MLVKIGGRISSRYFLLMRPSSRRQALEELARLLLAKEVVERPELLAILKVRSIGAFREKEKLPESGSSEIGHELKSLNPDIVRQVASHGPDLKPCHFPLNQASEIGLRAI